MAKFEVISKYENCGLSLPVRKTTQSAGYDFFVAEDIIIPPYLTLVDNMTCMRANDLGIAPDDVDVVDTPIDLNDLSGLTKEAEARPSLVPTGIKAKLDPGTYLELSVRSSCPLKYWLVLANSVGIIDADYYNNPDNEGHIYFQMINLSPFPIMLKKGDCIGQGIIKPYYTTVDDAAQGSREGGFGSTDSALAPAT